MLRTLHTFVKRLKSNDFKNGKIESEGKSGMDSTLGKIKGDVDDSA